MEKEGPQPAESEESSIYSPAIPREKWQRKRTQVKIRVCALWPSGAQPFAGAALSSGCPRVPRHTPGHGVMQLGGFDPICQEDAGVVPQPGGAHVPPRGLPQLPQAAECLVSPQNVTANHRASDVIVCEGKAQVLSGRFMYGPLDVVTLTGEKVWLGSWVPPGPRQTRWGCPGRGTRLVSSMAEEGMW